MAKMTAFEKLKAAALRKEAEFKKMTLAQKRVAIAKDVIADLRAKRYIAEHGTYLDLGKFEYDENGKRMLPEDGRDVLLSLPKCSVCAIGAVFCAVVKRKDKIEQSDLIWASDHDMIEFVKIFSEEQLRLMEVAFEGATPRDGVSGDDYWNARAFYQANDVDKDAYGEKLLIRIMENVISNNGKFNPLKGKHAVAKPVKPEPAEPSESEELPW